MNKRELMYKRIADHGNKLNTVFSLTGDPVKLCKRLHRLELEANQKMVAYCNGDMDEKGLEQYLNKTCIPCLSKIIGAENMDKIYVNHDPRGYTLKLTETESLKHTSMFKDWGGYAILAPDFSE